MKKLKFLLILLIFISVDTVFGNIIVGTKSYPVDTLAHYKVGPGSYYTALHLMDASKPLRVFFLEVDVKNPFISIKAVLGKDSTITTERPSAMAQRKTKAGAMYFGGVNADFFDGIGLPITGCMVDGEIARTPNARPDISFDRNIAAFVGIKTFAGNINFGGNSFSIAKVNDTRGVDQLVFYNSSNGHYTHTNAFGTEVLVQLVDPQWEVNKTVKVKVISVVSGKGNMSIPAGSAVLSGHGAAQTFLNKLKADDVIDVNLGLSIESSTVKPLLTDMVGGDRLILKDGIVMDNDWVELNPRTAVGYSSDKSKVYFCVVDGRSTKSVGVSTKQLADIMKSAGTFTAINLDGGGSSCLYIKEFNVMNSGSDGIERSVANALFAVSSAPTNVTISEIKAYQNTIELPKFGVFKPKFLGYNQYGTLINTDIQGVTLTCPAELGYINNLGQLVASGTQNGILTATYNGIQTKVNIVLKDEAEIAIRLDTVLIDNRLDYPIEVQSIIGQNTMQVLPSALTWTVLNPEICAVTNGSLKGLKNGNTLVIGNLGSFKDTLTVNVEIPTLPRMVQDDFNNLSSWTMTPSTSTWNTVYASDGLPNGWKHGVALRYTYQSARTPSIRMAKTMKMYSLPDTIKLVMNTGDVEISKLIVGFRANNQTLNVPITFNNVPKNTDTELNIPTSSIASNINDISSFPIWFDYFTMYISTTTQIVNTTYNVFLKEITLCYKNIVLGVDNPEILSELYVYPNPISGDEICISLKNESPETVKIHLFNISGQLIRTESFGIKSNGKLNWKVKELQTGIYFLKLQHGKKLTL